MTSKQLDEKIRKIAPKWLLAEVDNLIELAEAEEWEDPPIDCVDCFSWFSGQDWTNTRKYKLAMTKIDRAIGCQVQLKKDEVVYSSSSSGCRIFKEGDWVHSKRYDELIDENDESKGQNDG